ncbi:MAG TPA: hypothetical protein VI322_01665 [Candidatus Saccharimonadia bacterium]
MVITVLVGVIVIKEPHRKQSAAQSKPNLVKITQSALNLFRTHMPVIGIFLCLAVYCEGGRVLWQPRLTEAGLAVQYLGVTFALFKLASLLGAYLARHQRIDDVRRELTWLGILLAISLALMAAASLF